MARLPLNIALMPYAQQRRQMLGEQLLGAQSGVDPSATMYTPPNVGITATNAGGTQTSGQMPFQVPYMRQMQGGGMPQTLPQTLPNTLYDRATRGLGGIEGFRERQQQTPPQTPQSSMLAKIRSGLGASPTSPTGMALDSAAQSLLQQSGYSPVPRTTGQIFGEAMGAAREGYMGGKALEQAEADRLMAQRLADRDYALGLAKLGQPSEFARKMAELGIDLDTPEGQKQALEILRKPQTSVSFGDTGKKEEILFENALKYRDKIVDETKVEPKVESRLNQVIALLESGLDTGVVPEFTLPFRKLALGMGFIGDDESQNIAGQELLKSVADQLAPMMRVAGSGSSSDKDVELFRSATISMDKTAFTNLVIAKTLQQTNRHNKKRLALLDKYIEEKGSALGFGEYADENLDPVFFRVDGDEDLQKLYDEEKVKTEDVYYDNEYQKFMFVEVE